MVQRRIKPCQLVLTPLNVVPSKEFQPLPVWLFLATVEERNAFVHGKGPYRKSLVSIPEPFKLSSIPAVFIVVCRIIHPESSFRISIIVMTDNRIQLADR